MDPSAVFIYGTFMRGEFQSHVIERADPRCWILAECEGYVLHDLAGMPGAAPTDDDCRLQGELVIADDLDNLIAQLDRVAGYFPAHPLDSLYRRETVLVELLDGKFGEAWMYVLSRRPERRPIFPYDWRHHVGSRKHLLRRIARGHFEGQEEQVLSRLAPILPKGPASVDPEDVLLCGLVTERQLAQASGRWCVVP
jgi:gamma-glutamylcyclotransferase (GGCT)/AIG2-like uncharacterized protein YtfP